jgi:ligand-binding sensor domain-containing protein/signal transduction histidine kinase
MFKNKYLSLTKLFVICTLLQCLFLSVSAQSHTDLKFSHLTIDEGLSSNRTYGVVQDLDGYIWIGTNNGLNRYNGYEFKTYLYEPNNKYSISGNEVQTLYVDKNGSLWIGTNGRGFCYYDKVQDRFERMPYFETCSMSAFLEDKDDNLWVFGKSCIGKFHQKTKKFELISINNMPTIRKVVQSNENHIFWVGTQNGLYTFNTQNQTLLSFQNIKDKLPFDDIIMSLYLDKDKILWMGSGEGKINCLNTQTLALKHLIHKPQDSNSPPNFTITTFVEDGRQMLIGTLNGGLSIFNKNTQQFRHYTYQKNNKEGLNDNAIGPEIGLFKDKQGRIWIPTNFGGLNIVDRYTTKFNVITDLPNPTVNAVLKDSKRRLWIGTEKGLVKINPNGITKEYLDFPVLSVEEDDLGRVWLGSWGKGVLFYNESEDKFTQYIQKNDFYRNNMFKVIPEKSFIWLSTGIGLTKMNYDNMGEFVNYMSDCQTSDAFLMHSFKIEDKIWICSDNGLKVFDIKTEQTTCISHHPNDAQSLSSNFITNILYDSRGRYWIGTKEGLNLKTDEKYFKRITKADGLPSESVNSMLEDNKGYLWLATNKGLSKYNTEKETFRNYDVSDGLQSNEFRSSSCFKDRNGFLYFGGVKGLTIFHPDSIRDNPYIPKVYMSGLRIYNKPVSIRDSSKVLAQNISLTQSLTFDHTQSVFTLEFVALNYTHPEKNQYAYKLEGFDKDWVYAGYKREATYTNLDAGTYTFRVKASNNDDLWNEEGASITIIILPAWWETWWFRIGIILILLGSSSLFYKIRINTVKRQKLEKDIAERTLEISQKTEELKIQKKQLEAQAENLAQVINTKDRIFAILGHDLRSPIDSLANLMKLVSQKSISLDVLQMYADKLKINVKQVHFTLTNLLFWANGQMQGLASKPQPLELYRQVETNFNLVQEVALEKRIVLVNLIQQNATVWADRDQVDMVLRNLINNAIKFTPPEGPLRVGGSLKSDCWELFVQDSGVGIAPENLSRIFSANRGYTTPGTDGEKGTGLGLAICHEMIAMNGGKIWLESEVGKGTTIFFTLPIQN